MQVPFCCPYTINRKALDRILYRNELSTFSTPKSPSERDKDEAIDQLVQAIFDPVGPSLLPVPPTVSFNPIIPVTERNNDKVLDDLAREIFD